MSDSVAASDRLDYRISGRASDPAIIYLPGVHGDWTPMERARPQLNRSLQLVEVAYPQRWDWTLEDFSRALGGLLDELQWDSAHLLGESFGSLVGWQFGLGNAQRVRSLILVGGFCGCPCPLLAPAARWGLTVLPTRLWELGVDCNVLRKRARGQPCGRQPLPYPVVRGPAGRRAAVQRLALIQRADYSDKLSQIPFPVRYIGGQRDWLVAIQQELQVLQSGLPAACCFESRILADASHALLVTHPHATAQYVRQWIEELETET